jgi:hypothetical protein
MQTRKTQNSIVATVNELATFIRANAPIKFGKVAIAKKVAPSTLYGYVKIMLDLCEDIQFEHGVFSVTVEAMKKNEATKETGEVG